MSTRRPASALVGAVLSLMLGLAPLQAIANPTSTAPAQTATRLSGDVTRGEAIYARCGACHALTYDRTGPRHCGLFDRRVGGLPGFEYSQAMQQSTLRWTPETLDAFIAAPMQYIPGTSMGYAGITDAQERADLIAYLLDANAGPACQPSQ